MQVNIIHLRDEHSQTKHLFIRSTSLGAGEVVQWLTALVSLAEDPNTHVVAHSPSVTPVLGMWSTCMQANIHGHKVKVTCLKHSVGNECK